MTSAGRPLCVDCDGTLLRTDLLHESVFILMKRSIVDVFRLPFWLCKGKAYLKQQISRRVEIDASLLPYNHELIEYLVKRRNAGDQIVLVTASPRAFAERVAMHTQVFDAILATENGRNLAGTAKAAELVAQYGERGFDYAGNSSADLPVWEKCAGAITVDANSAFTKKVSKLAPIVAEFRGRPRTARDYFRAIRVHQWLKNLLVFVPLVTSHQLLDLSALWVAVLAFLSYGLCASSVYILNDLLDLQADRQHVRKAHRPFASGQLPIVYGVMLIPVLLMASVAIGISLPTGFLVVLSAYYFVTVAYSISLKNRPIVDVITLAILYTFRIIAGAVAVGVFLSFWLLAFSMFIFLSLAMVKRYSELAAVKKLQRTAVIGRGYLTEDLQLLMTLGSASGYSSVLVMALYLNSSDVHALYSASEVLWLILPALLFWISRLWMITSRGEMHDDPVVFAVKDRASHVVAGFCALVLVVATIATSPFH